MADKIIILRPKADSADYIAQVEAMGYGAIAEEILSVTYMDGPLPPLNRETPIVFTSANGVRAFARLSAERGHPIFTVGSNTADEARAAGFQNPESADGTAEDLIELVLKRSETGLKSLFYVRGEDVSVNLGQILREKGINLDEFIGYKANLSENLSIETLKSLKNRDIKAVLAFSARGAAHFSALVRQYGRENALKTAQALCIGQGVVESFHHLPFKEVVVASTPDRYGMMSLLQSLPNRSKSEDS